MQRMRGLGFSAPKNKRQYRGGGLDERPAPNKQPRMQSGSPYSGGASFKPMGASRETPEYMEGGAYSGGAGYREGGTYGGGATYQESDGYDDPTRTRPTIEPEEARQDSEGDLGAEGGESPHQRLMDAWQSAEGDEQQEEVTEEWRAWMRSQGYSEEEIERIIIETEENQGPPPG